MKKGILLMILAAGLAAPAHADIHLDGVEWQAAAFRRKGRLVYEPIESLVRSPGKRTRRRIRAVIDVKADSGQDLDGVVLRFAVAAKLASVDEEAPAARWVVPFRVEERRIPRLKAGRTQRVRIDTIKLENYLRSLSLSGYWPVEIRLQVMAKPKPGVHLDDAMIEAVLPIHWE